MKEVLKESKHLRLLPLVDNPKNMILLGSVQRYELINIIDKHIGHERRLEVAAQWKQEADEKEEEQRVYRIMVEKYRNPSRFESAPDIAVRLQQAAKQAEKENSQIITGPQPTKSILKKNNSFTIGFKPINPTRPSNPSYSTFASENSLRSAFENVFRKSATLQDVQTQNDPEMGMRSQERSSSVDDQILSKKVQLPTERVCDMSPEEQKAWEKEEMAKPVDLEASNVRIDPSPFQLVERTSLLKVHYLFSMTGINHAFVTNIGRLVGVVAMKEVCHKSKELTETLSIFIHSFARRSKKPTAEIFFQKCKHLWTLQQFRFHPLPSPFLRKQRKLKKINSTTQERVSTPYISRKAAPQMLNLITFATT